MDGVHGGTQLAGLLVVWDQFEQLLSEKPAVVALVTLAVISLLSYRRWADILAILSIASLLTQDASLRSHKAVLVVCLIATLLTLHIAWPKRKSKTAEACKDPTIAVPSPPPPTTRDASRPEQELELAFRSYLEYLVNGSNSSIVVHYVPYDHTLSYATLFRSRTSNDNSVKLVFKVLNPAFYIRFVHYAHDSEAIFSELAESRTIWVDRPDLLTDVFLKKGSAPLHARGLLDFACFELIRKLRRRPQALHQADALKDTETVSKSDIRVFRISSMDAYILRHEDTKLRIAYRNTLLKLFIADRLLGGSYTMLSAVLWTLRLFGCWTVVTLLVKTMSTA